MTEDPGRLVVSLSAMRIHYAVSCASAKPPIAIEPHMKQFSFLHESTPCECEKARDAEQGLQITWDTGLIVLARFGQCVFISRIDWNMLYYQ